MANPKKRPYNTTDLQPYDAFERQIEHRDMLGHLARWTHVLKNAKIGDIVVDFGCGSGNLLETLYRNKFKCKEYIGIDIREKTIEGAREKYKMIDWATFIADDLIHPNEVYEMFGADKVVSFEVMEHVGKQNADKFLQNFKACGHEKATYYLSTPNYDAKVGAAGNHTYDSGDGRGVQPQEHTHREIEEAVLRNGFEIKSKFGTFASQSDYKMLMADWQEKMFAELSKYYSSTWISVMFAPMFPEHSRNTLWVLNQKSV